MLNSILIHYIPVNDKEHYKNHIVPFANFMRSTFPNNFKLVDFIGKEPNESETHHTIGCPDNKTKLDLILDLLKTD